MQEVILNLLPVTEEEKGEFAAIAPRAEHIYTSGSAVTAEELARATVIFGWPRPERLAQAKSLRWFQTMWAGTDEYAGHIPAGAKFTSSSGSNQVSVAEHILASLLAVCRRLPVYRDSQRLHQWKDRGRMKCVRGSTVLVVGAGHIGSTFAAMCQGLGAHTLGLKRTVHGPVEGFDQVFPMERLDDLLPQKLIPVAVERSGIPPHQKVHDLTREQRRKLVQGLKHFSVEIAGPCPVTDAIVTSGGIKISEIDPKTMESKLVKGLYFSGEIMDVDAYTGGFNLQIAWATGRAAGQAAAEALRQGEENA